MNEVLDYDDFKFYLGETIEFCQTIEYDTKWIYAIMKKGNSSDNFDNISEWTLGKTVKLLQKMDYEDDDHYLGEKDYELLKEIVEERNYLCHEIYRSFLYINNWKYSNEYRKACSRMMKFHNHLEKLQDSIEKVRLKALEYYR